MGGREFKLILGTPLETTVHPWRILPVKAVMVNAYAILSSGRFSSLRGRGLRRLLGIGDDVELWLDSGGYQFLRAGIDPGPAKIAKIYREIDADYYISLDYPPSPNDSPETRALKIARTVAAYQTMKSLLRGKVEDGRLVPVFHLSTGEALRIQYTVYYPSSCIAAVGGLIPYFMQRAGRYSRLKAVLFLSLVRKIWDGKLHALGIASAAVIPLLKIIGVDSGDTQTWRHKAGYGKIIIPGAGERHISSQQVRFGPAKLRENEINMFNDLVAKASRLLGITREVLTSSFEARALFNAWILVEVANNGVHYNGVSKPFQRLYELARKYIRLSSEALEEELSRIMNGGKALFAEKEIVNEVSQSNVVQGRAERAEIPIR
jgi:7-cyano-7-deazaguanine tRNA-ribosyltransferase